MNLKLEQAIYETLDMLSSRPSDHSETSKFSNNGGTSYHRYIYRMAEKKKPLNGLILLERMLLLQQQNGASSRSDGRYLQKISKLLNVSQSSLKRFISNWSDYYDFLGSHVTQKIEVEEIDAYKNDVDVKLLKKIKITVNRENKELVKVLIPNTYGFMTNIPLVGSSNLLDHHHVKKWQEAIKKHFKKKTIQNVLLVPCSRTKPFSKGRLHSKIIQMVESLKLENDLAIFVISEPLGMIPLYGSGITIDWENRYPAAHYDMTLPAWLPLSKLNQEKVTTKKRNQIFSSQGKTPAEARLETRRIIDALSHTLAEMFEVVFDSSTNIFVYLRSTHLQMVEKAFEHTKENNWNVEYILSKPRVRNIIKKKGTLHWVFQGLKSKEALTYLEKTLMKI